MNSSEKTISTKTTNFFENKIYLYISKKLSKDDIELILLYFQAKNYSGGDDIIDSNYDRQRNVLEINYLKNVTKQEILKRHRFSYRNYVFEAFDPPVHDCHSDFLKLRNSLIFDNITKSETLDDIGIYINCIVKNSIIFKIEYSNILDNKIYVEFKDSNLDFDEIRSNLAKRPTFRNNFVKVYEAYETNAVLMKIHNANIKNFVDYLNKNFMIKDQCYWQVPFDFEDSPFIIIKFKNGQAKQRFILGFTASDIKDVFIENLCNIQMLNDYLQKYKNYGFQSRYHSSMNEFREDYTSSSINNNSSMFSSLKKDESINSSVSHLNIVTLETDNKNAINEAVVKYSNEMRLESIRNLNNQTFVNDLLESKIYPFNNDQLYVTVNDNGDTSDPFLSNTGPINNERNYESTIMNNEKVLKRRIKPRDYPKKCPYCPYYAHQASSYSKHMKRHEYQPDSYKCKYCSFSVAKRIALCSHESLHTERLMKE